MKDEKIARLTKQLDHTRRAFFRFLVEAVKLSQEEAGMIMAQGVRYEQELEDGGKIVG